MIVISCRYWPEICLLQYKLAQLGSWIPVSRPLQNLTILPQYRLGGNGKIAKNLIASCKYVPRRIAASGTPAPNDKTEYAMIALWLGYVNSEKEFYSMYFVNKDGEYVLRRHATEKFYQYLASCFRLMIDLTCHWITPLPELRLN